MDARLHQLLHPTMRRPVLVTVIGALVFLIDVAFAQRPPGSRVEAPAARRAARDWVADLSEWVEAAYRHTPGSPDEHAFAILGWTDDDLRAMVEDLQAVRVRLAKGWGRIGRSGSAGRSFTHNDRTLDVFEVQRLLRLSEDEARHGDVNRLVHRGAMLHADIAILLMEPGSSRESVLIKDGRYERPGERVSHFEVGRLLLDLVTPSTSVDDLACLWYKATAAYLVSMLAFSEAEPHLARGRQLFEADADLSYLSARVHEHYAAPDIQTYVAAFLNVRGWRPSVGPANVHLKQAEVQLRRVVALRPAAGEAHLRLGRVLGLLGKHDEAAEELELALSTIGEDPYLAYYGHLFLGEEEEVLGRRASAVDHYTRAAALFPGAQSPKLALAQIARRYGDRKGALLAIDQLLMLPGDATQRGDPWWTYQLLPSSDAETLLRALRTRVADLETP